MTEVTGIKDIIKPENLVYKKTGIMTDNVLHYCPGCGHSTTHRILAEIIDEEGLQSEAIGISPVGCSVFLYHYIDIDWQEAAHGRAPALAAAIKRLCPHKFVFTYREMVTLLLSGHRIHACNRGENFRYIINNNIYSIINGQIARHTSRAVSTSPTRKNTEISFR